VSEPSQKLEGDPYAPSTPSASSVPNTPNAPAGENPYAPPTANLAQTPALSGKRPKLATLICLYYFAAAAWGVVNMLVGGTGRGDSAWAFLIMLGNWVAPPSAFVLKALAAYYLWHMRKAAHGWFIAALVLSVFYLGLTIFRTGLPLEMLWRIALSQTIGWVVLAIAIWYSGVLKKGGWLK
jgi:hypothetical protein